MSTLALIGLGSNLGDRRGHLDAAVAGLAETPGVVVRAISAFHETAPVGGPGGQGAFLNAAGAVETTLDPFGLLAALRAIEARSGRVRAVRWGERTLDLDLLLFADRVIDAVPDEDPEPGGATAHLQIPHPRMAVRRFVLGPLAEIAPESVDPLTGRTIADLLANLDRRPSLVALHNPLWATEDSPFVDLLFRKLLAELPASGLAYGGPCGEFRERQAAGRLTERNLLLHSWFERQCHDLSLGRWTSGTCEDRWLVSDFWLDAFLDEGPRGRLLEIRDRVLTPTFAVVPRGWRVLRSRLSPEEHWQPPLGDTPTLEVDFDRPDAACSDILAACRASRPG